MSTASANATALSDRRHFLSTVAAAGSLILPAIPALAQTPGPIETMYADHLRLEAALDAACMVVMDAEERYEEPDRPKWHPATAEGGYEIIPTSPGRGRALLDIGDKNVAYLRELISKEFDLDDVDGFGEARAKVAKRTLAEIKAWKAEDQRRRDAAGLTIALAAEQEIVSEDASRCAAIFALKATTFRELAFQAAILDVDWHQARAERVLERLVELAGVSPSSLA